MAELTLQASESVLLVLDMQNDLLHEKGAISHQMGVLPMLQEMGVVENTRRVIELARRSGVPVIYVRTIFRPDYADAGDLSLRRMLKEQQAFREGSWGAEIVEELTPLPTDYVVTKRRVNPFYQTDLELLLRCLKRNVLVIAGVATNFCVEMAVRSTLDRDFEPVVLYDCTATFSQEAQDFPMRVIFSRIARVTTSRELTFR